MVQSMQDRGLHCHRCRHCAGNTCIRQKEKTAQAAVSCGYCADFRHSGNFWPEPGQGNGGAACGDGIPDTGPGVAVGLRDAAGAVCGGGCVFARGGTVPESRTVPGGHGGADRDAHTDSNADTYAYADSNADAHTDTYADSNADTHTYAHTYADTRASAHTRTYADTRSQCGTARSTQRSAASEFRESAPVQLV